MIEEKAKKRNLGSIGKQGKQPTAHPAAVLRGSGGGHCGISPDEKENAHTVKEKCKIPDAIPIHAHTLFPF
jgi:hypothetical protein